MTGGRLARLLVVAGALLVLGAAPAAAHTDLERSDPPNGGMLASGRTSLTLWFGEPILAPGSFFTVGRTDGSAPAVAVDAAVDDTGRVVHLTVPPLGSATYTLTWAVTAEDGHPTRGTVVFGSGFRPDGVAASGTTAPDPAAVAVRAVDIAGTLVAVGCLAVAGRVLAALGAAGPVLRRRVLGVGAVGATLALAAALATPVLSAAGQVGEASGPGALASAVRDVLVGTRWGVLWSLRLAALVVAYLALWVARREPTRRRPATVAAVALVVAVAADAFAGHAATLPARSGLAAVAAALHVLAAGVWAGGLVVMVLAVDPVRRLTPPDRRAAALAGWRAFSPMAAASVGVLAATGVYEAGRHVEDVGSATDSTYGTALAAKVLVLGVALLLAGYNTLVVNAGLAARVGRTVGLGSTWRPPRATLHRTVLAEALVLVLAVALAALMTSVPTAREVAVASTVTVPHTDTVDGLFVTAEAVPSGSDVRVVVRTEEVLRPMPWPVTGVDVTLVEGTEVSPTAAPADRLPLGVVEAGRYEGSVADPGLAAWTAEVAVHRAGRPDVVLLVPGSSAVGGPVGPLELATGGLALVLLLVTGTAVVVVRRRTTSPSSGTPTPSDAPSEDVPEVPLLQEASHR